MGGLKCSDGPSDRILPVLDLGADTAHACGPYDGVQLGGLGQRLQLAEGMAGKAATGLLVVDDNFGAAAGILAPVLRKRRVHVHLLISLFEIFCHGRVGPRETGRRQVTRRRPRRCCSFG